MKRQINIGVCGAALLLAPLSGATAATKNWVGGSGNWNVPGNWSLAGVPLANDAVIIAPTDGVARTITYDVTAPTLLALTVDLTGAGTNRTTFNATGNNLTLTNGPIIGDNGRATFNHSAGTVSYSNPNLDAVVGFHTGGDGVYNLSGTGNLVVARGLYIGTFGGSIGQFNQTGGTTNVQSLILGANAGAIGTYTLSGGTVTASADIFVGNLGTGSGTLTIQSGTTVHAGNNLSINGSSTVNLNGGTLRFLGYTPQAGSQFNYNSGTIKLGGGRAFGFDTAITALFGASPVIPVNKALIIEGDADFRTHVVVDGGTLTGQSGLFRVGFNNNGSVSVINGGSMVTNTTAYMSVATGVVSTVNVTGPGSSWAVNGDLWAGVEGNATMNVTGGGTVTTTGDGLIAYDVSSPFTTVGKVLVSGSGSIWTVGDDLGVGGPAGAGTLTIEDQGTVYVTDTLFIDISDTLNLNGGTIRFNSYIPSTGAVFNFNAGTIQLGGNRSLGSDSVIQQLYGGAPRMTTGKGLTVEGTSTLLTTTTVDGGTFTTNGLVNGHNLKLQHGTFNLQNQALTIAAGQPLGATLDLASDMTVNVTSGMTNQGLVTGDGQIGGQFTNAAGGELRVEPGKSLTLTGVNNTNAGQVNLFGGLIEFTQDLTNQSAGFISGNGTLITQAGLTNQGTMNFSGAMNIVGDVTNTASGKVISSGGGPTTFFDDVVNQGQVRTSAGGSTVFFGSLSGSGSFTGTGTVNIEGDLKPGNSAATVQFAGNLDLSPSATLEIELGGLTPGSLHDRLEIAGIATLDGTLVVSLINGFTPSLGNTFGFLIANGGFGGAFASFNLPNLSGLGLDWLLNPVGSTLVLEVVAATQLIGDLNGDGFVGIADLNLVLGNWNQSVPPGNPLADPSGDGFVGIADLNTVLGNWNAGTPPVNNAHIPEPGTLGVLGMLSGLNMRRRPAC